MQTRQDPETQPQRHQDAVEIHCRMAFQPEALADAVLAIAEQDVVVLGYAFEPHEDRGRARFLTSDPTNAVLALESLGLEPEQAAPGEDEGPWPDA